jgi:hypothetical protein
VEGLFVLLGVVAGGLVSWAVQVALERRRDMHEIVRSKRLVAEELSTVFFHVTRLTETRMTPREPAPGIEDWGEKSYLPNAAWAENKKVLADKRATSEDEFTVLATNFFNAEALRFDMLSRPPNEDLTDEEVERISDLANQVNLSYALFKGEKIIK